MKKLLAAIVCIAVVGLASGFWAWRQSRVVPGWWSPPDPATPGLAAAGESLENNMVTQVSKVRSVEAAEWTQVLAEDAVNAWLATRLSQWIKHRNAQASGEIHQPHVRVDGERIRLGLRVGPDGDDLPLSISLIPSLDDEGKLRIRIESFGLGRLPIPFQSLLLPFFAAFVPESDAAALLAGEPVEPVVEVSRNRYVRLVGLTLAPERMVLRCRTEPRN